MFPLKVVLIGRDEESLPPLRRAIREHTLEDPAEFPDVEQVLKQLRPSDKFALVALVQTNQDLAELRRLSHAFAGHGILAIVDRHMDSIAAEEPDGFSISDWELDSLYHRAMRAGAAQLAVAPIDKDDIGRALDCLALHFGGVRSQSKIIAVSGATGGVGATVLATNLAYEISELTQRRCVLTEPQAHMGMVASYLNLHPAHTLRDLLELDEINLQLVKEVLTSVTPRLSALCAPDGFGIYQPSIERLLEILDALRDVAPYIVLDLPCTMDVQYFELLEEVNTLVLVAEQTLPSVRNLRMIREAIGGCQNIERSCVVISKYDASTKGFSSKSLCDLFGLDRIWTVERSPHDIPASINMGRPLRLQAPQSQALRQIDALTRYLVPCPEIQQKPEPRGVKRLFNYIFAEV